jgi:hypothetical protein
MDKVNTKKYDINLAAESHVLAILHRLGYEATFALGHKATMELGNKKDVDIIVFKPDGRIAKIDVIGTADHRDWSINAQKLFRRKNLYIVLVCFSNKIADPNECPSVWVVPLRDLKKFINEYRTKTVVSHSKILKKGEKYFQAWDTIA